MKLAFVRGSALRNVVVKDNKVTISTGELGFQPFTIDLNRLEELENDKAWDSLEEDDKKLIRQIAKLGTDKEIAADIIKDFKKTGWRPIKNGTR